MHLHAGHVGGEQGVIQGVRGVRVRARIDDDAREALFLRTYTPDVTLIHVGTPQTLPDEPTTSREDLKPFLPSRLNCYGSERL